MKKGAEAEDGAENAKKGGRAQAAWIIATAGIAIGTMPLLWVVPLAAGAVAIGLSITTLRQGHGGTPGAILGALALLIAIWGMHTVDTAFEEAERDMQEIRERIDDERRQRAEATPP